MTEEQIYMRFISQLTGFPLDILEAKKEDCKVPKDMERAISKAVTEMMAWDFHTLCGEDMTIKEIGSEIRTLHSIEPLDCIWLDYYSDILPRAELSQVPRHEQMADINRDVKSLKKELPVPIVLLAQLKREAVDRYPRKTDLAESSSCEKIADGILLLDRPKKGRDVNERNYWINNRTIPLEELYDKCAIVIGKNRFGPEMVSVYGFNGPLMRFEGEDPLSQEIEYIEFPEGVNNDV